jgi:hypothetical protein
VESPESSEKGLRDIIENAPAEMQAEQGRSPEATWFSKLNSRLTAFQGTLELLALQGKVSPDRVEHIFANLGKIEEVSTKILKRYEHEPANLPEEEKEKLMELFNHLLDS